MNGGDLNKDSIKPVLKIANWLKSIENADGLWPEEVGNPSKISGSIASGVGGQVLFFIDLWKATKDSSYLLKAKKGASYLCKQMPNNIDSLPPNGAFTPYGSICGAALALMEYYQLDSNPEYYESIQGATNLLFEASKERDSSVYWTKQNDLLIGLAGYGLFLLEASDFLNSKETLNLARETADTLLDRAIKDSAGLNWKMNEQRDFILPNFSHGAAGIGYFLATLYEKNKEERYLDASIKTANYLYSIGQREEDIFMLPYGFPDLGWERPYDIGWAHGPAGTARFFYKMYQITHEEKYLRTVRHCANSLLKSGLPGAPLPPFGASPFPVDQRFGLCGVADFFLDLYRIGQEERDLNFAYEVLDIIRSKGTEENNKLYWTIPKYGFMRNKKESVTFSGHFYGATGIGLVLLKAYAIENKLFSPIRLPDNPF